MRLYVPVLPVLLVLSPLLLLVVLAGLVACLVFRVSLMGAPVTTIVNTIRDLFTQQPVGTDIWTALAWCVGILIVAYIFAMSTYRRKIT